MDIHLQDFKESILYLHATIYHIPLINQWMLTQVSIKKNSIMIMMQWYQDVQLWSSIKSIHLVLTNFHFVSQNGHNYLCIWLKTLKICHLLAVKNELMNSQWKTVFLEMLLLRFIKHKLISLEINWKRKIMKFWDWWRSSKIWIVRRLKWLTIPSIIASNSWVRQEIFQVSSAKC